MTGLTPKARGRTHLAGKVIFNFGQSTIDCVVKRLAEDGATIELENGLGIPDRFQLSLVSERMLVPCKLVWQSEKQIGVSFEAVTEGGPAEEKRPAEHGPDHALRNQMLALRAAFDHVPLGIVLLDSKLNARFINRAFRRMWALPDEVAD